MKDKCSSTKITAQNKIIQKYIDNDRIYKTVGDFEITCSVDKLSILKHLQITSNNDYSKYMSFEIYKHGNNVYIFNKTILSHYNYKSKQLKSNFTSANNIECYKMLGIHLYKDIQQNNKNERSIQLTTKQHNKIMNQLQIGDIYYYTFFGYGLPCVKGYKIIEKNKSSIKVQQCLFTKKVTNKQIKYEIIGTTGENFSVKVYKNQAFNINGNEVVRANSNKIITKL